LYKLYKFWRGTKIMVVEMLTHFKAAEAREHFRLVVREAVREERPVVISPRDEDAAVVVSRAQLLTLLDNYECHVDIIPEEDTGGFTIWIEELRATAYGETFAAACTAMVGEVSSYVRHFLAEWPRLKHTDRAKDLPYIARLALAETTDEMHDLLFSRLQKPPSAR